MRVAIVCTAALVLSSCGNTSSEPGADPTPTATDTSAMSCGELLRSGPTLDYRVEAHLPEAEEPVADVSAAFTEVETFLGNVGCAAGDVAIDEEMASGCSDIEETGFRVCLVATNEGQFFVHEIYPDLVSVMWNRWD